MLWILLALIIPSLGYIGVGLFVAAWLSTPSHQQEKEQRVPSDVGLDYRKVNFKAADGLELAAWWVPSKGPPSGAVVLVPGLGGDKSRHCKSPYLTGYDAHDGDDNEIQRLLEDLAALYPEADSDSEATVTPPALKGGTNGSVVGPQASVLRGA